MTIAAPEEPGPRLEVTGTVRSAKDGKPLPGVTVYVYHADQRGRYGDGSGRGDPRLCGIMRTNERGGYRFRTVMPGGYVGGAHIHYEVWGRGVDRRAFVLTLGRVVAADSAGHDGPRLLDAPRLLEGPRPLPGERRDGAWMGRPLVRDAAGVLRVEYDLPVSVR